MLGVDLFWGEFLDGAVPDGRDGVSVVEAVMGITRADVVYGHSPNDSHQDHRATATVTMAAARQILFSTPARALTASSRRTSSTWTASSRADLPASVS